MSCPVHGFMIPSITTRSFSLLNLLNTSTSQRFNEIKKGKILSLPSRQFDSFTKNGINSILTKKRNDSNNSMPRSFIFPFCKKASFSTSSSFSPKKFFGFGSKNDEMNENGNSKSSSFFFSPLFSLPFSSPFSSSSSNLARLINEADSHPDEAKKQTRLYKALLESNDPDALIKRFENVTFARDADGVVFYLCALYETSQLERIAKLFINERNSAMNGIEDAMGIAGKKGGNEGKSSFNSNFNSSNSNSSHSFPLGLLNFGTKERPLYVHSSSTSGQGWKRIGTIVNILIIGGILWTVFSFNDQKIGGFSTKVHKFFHKDPKQKLVTFDDVQGCDEAKQELQEVVEFLKNPTKFTKLGAKMPKGVLLVGPPGTGKTLLAKAVAGEADVPFIYAAGSSFDEVFVGLGSMRIRQMFENAKEQAPAIIFIDELDAIGSRRNPKDPQHSRMSLNQLLAEMDGFAESTGIVVIGATNIPETLDKALLRPGRFDKHVTVSLPDIRGRRNILEMYLGDTNLATDVDIQTMARATPGFSGADLFKMINQAKIMASVENVQMVTMKHLELSKDEMIMGVERKSAIIREEDRRLTAFHESGHAIVAHYTPEAMPIHKATIIPRGKALGMVSQLPETDEQSLTKAQLLARMDVAIGGRIAEEIVYGNEKITTGAQSDFGQATAIARAMVCQYGMSEKIGVMVVDPDELESLSFATRELIDKEIQKLLDESRIRATVLLKSKRRELDRLAESLLEYETLSKEQIERALKGNLKLEQNSRSNNGEEEQTHSTTPNPFRGNRERLLEILYP